MWNEKSLYFKGRLEKMEKLRFYLNWILRLILAATFAYAAINKIIYPDVFFNGVRNYQLIPDSLSYIVAYFLPAFEIVVAGFLLTNRFFHVTLLCMALMLVIFIMAIFSAWGRGLDISCGCFGSGSPEGYGVIIFRDLLLLFICFILTWINHKNCQNV